MAHALQIDTLAFTKKLREAGAEEGLAEAIVEGLTAADTSELATKGDIAEVKIEIAEVRTEIAEVRTEIIEAKSELKQDILKVENKIDNVKSELKVEIAQSTNKAIYTLGGLVTALFIIDRIIPLFGVGN